MQSLTLSPTADPRRLKAPDGSLLTPPAGWALLPPGDAGLTRRVKLLGPAWTVIEQRGRKKFSRGVWAPAEHIAAARSALDAERADPAHAKRLASAAARRDRAQVAYVDDFRDQVLAFLRFSPAFGEHASRLADAVTAHATPVGSGTVARTERIPIERRAEAAVIAWLRHQTTAYDQLSIPRIKGSRREVRQQLAQVSRALLDVHRHDRPHATIACPLCRALAEDARDQT